ncbi:MAG: class I SAM-dependent methyltransferase [Betaproteobacteria bacterium]|nr:class I SAM-dependent methyltransferase [Betaproteobacteria bacterium]
MTGIRAARIQWRRLRYAARDVPRDPRKPEGRLRGRRVRRGAESLQPAQPTRGDRDAVRPRAARSGGARVLEVGCGDGANLLPMAARMPGATFTGCDASALLMRRANDMARGLGLANVEFVEGDLREVAGSLGTFDYVIAHGFYSWVPADVRDAFLALAHGHLAPGGLVYVSYNVLPGCFVRQIGWDAIKLEDAGAATARERLEGARRVRRDLAQAWRAAGGMAAMLAPELADDAGRTDGRSITTTCRA